MEQLLHEMNVCIGACYILNAALIGVKGPKISQHFLASSSGRVTLDEINNAFKTLFGTETPTFSTKEAAVLEGSEGIRYLDSCIITKISSLNRQEKLDLLAKLEEIYSIEGTRLGNLEMQKMETIEAMEFAYKTHNRDGYKQKIVLIKTLSRECSITEFYYKRYSHYMAYIKGLLYSNQKSK